MKLRVKSQRSAVNVVIASWEVSLAKTSTISQIVGRHVGIVRNAWRNYSRENDLSKRIITGQITLDEYLRELADKATPVDIKGLCDDAYCPRCNVCLDEIRFLDCELCPYCGLRIDWGPWHHFNDEENV